MIKNAKVEPGVTPSSLSGKPSTHVVDGEPLAEGEEPGKTIKKAAKALEPTLGLGQSPEA